MSSASTLPGMAEPPAPVPQRTAPTHLEPASIRLARALAVAENVPPVITECREVVEAARAGKLPVRPQPWETQALGVDSRPLRTGTFDQDPNGRITLIAADIFYLWDKRDDLSEEQRESVRRMQAELQAWATELQPVLAAQTALEEALTTFRKAAPTRIVS